MNKKILGVALAVLFVAMLATPAMAVPTKGQKVPVTMEWASVDGTRVTVESHDSTDGLSHRILTQKWTVNLFIDGSLTPLEGTADSVRHVLFAFGKLQKAVYYDEYIISFPSEDGGFEGGAHLLLTLSLIHI